MRIRYLGEAEIDGAGLRSDFLTNEEEMNGVETVLAQRGGLNVEVEMLFTAGFSPL